MTPEELIEAVTKMTSGEWTANGSFEAMAGDRKVAKAMAMGSGGNEYVDPARDANIDGICALRNHAVRIIQSLISERDAALARVAELEGADWRGAYEDDVKVILAVPDPNTRDAGPSPFSGRTTRREG